MPLGQTSLHVAASWGLYSTAEWLIIELSENVHSQRSIDNATPLHLALRSGNDGIARMLIEYGTDPTAQSKDGETPLHRASEWEQMGVARVLIEDVGGRRAQSNEGKTPLHRASE